jgi:glyoxylase-like metal-dependent hydrolase (beta-lactamase superfamily II)
MFPQALVVDVDSVYDGSLWLDHDGDGYHLSDDISVIETPGHAQECAALVVRTETGTVVLTHAWWFSDMTPERDPLAWSQESLDLSRERILEIADVVVPGHGPAFRPADVRGTR